MQPSEGSSLFAGSVRQAIRVRHFSIRAEQQHVQRVRRFTLFHGKRHPLELGLIEVFLTHRAVAGKAIASTQNQAKSWLLFRYREVVASELPWLTNVEQAKAPARSCVVFTERELDAVLNRVSGTQGLVAQLALRLGHAGA